MATWRTINFGMKCRELSRSTWILIRAKVFCASPSALKTRSTLARFVTEVASRRTADHSVISASRPLNSDPKLCMKYLNHQRNDTNMKLDALSGLIYFCKRVVGKGGLEPPRLSAHDPKSCSSANSDTPPDRKPPNTIAF